MMNIWLVKLTLVNSHGSAIENEEVVNETVFEMLGAAYESENEDAESDEVEIDDKGSDDS